jgi:hypothetical protein
MEQGPPPALGDDVKDHGPGETDGKRARPTRRDGRQPAKDGAENTINDEEEGGANDGYAAEAGTKDAVSEEGAGRDVELGPPKGAAQPAVEGEPE